MLKLLQSWLAKRFRPKSLGERGEDYAVRYLKRLGYHVLARQADSRVGEIDVVAADGRTIVFVEVKTRSSTAVGSPADAVDDRKKVRMTRAALAYLKARGLLDYQSRFDVVAITWPEGARKPIVEHFRDAFPAIGRGQFFR